jgi:hypothetical protein
VLYPEWTGAPLAVIHLGSNEKRNEFETEAADQATYAAPSASVVGASLSGL